MDKQVTTPRGGHLEALLNGCPDAILAINADGTIKFANKEACKLTERSMNELIGENIVEVYENEAAARAANRKIYEAGGTVHDLETKTKTKSGKLIPVRVSASHLYDSNGKYIGGVGYFAKYRPWANAEAANKTRLEELEAKLDKWKALAAPVFEIYPGLSVMVVVGKVDTDRFDDVMDNLLEHVENVRTRVVILDLSAALIEENEVADQIAKAIRTVRLLGAECIIADMQVAMAKALEPLMAELSDITSYNSMERALEDALSRIGYQIRPID